MTPGELRGLAFSFRAARALFAAVELGVFEALAAGTLAPGDLARERGCDARALRILLDALVALEVLELAAGGYRIPEALRAALVPGGADYLGNLFLHDLWHWSRWASLDRIVQSGAPFQAVTCVAVSADKLVYVCDRTANRIQVFRADGTFVKEGRVSAETGGNGAVWDIAFSSDRGQARLFVADGQNQKVWMLNRDTLQIAGSVGAGGRWPGHFYAVTGVALDSEGNLYTAETLEGKRVQKFAARR